MGTKHLIGHAAALADFPGWLLGFFNCWPFEHQCSPAKHPPGGPPSNITHSAMPSILTTP